MGKNNEELNIINYALMKKRTDALDQKIDDAIVGVFTNGGSVAFENLPALSLDKVGWAYQITDDFTTTSDFVEGEGKDYHAGTFVSIANTGTDASPVLKYNAMLGVIIVDTALSTTSKNAVENRVITTDLLTRLQKVSAMPQNPSNNDLVLWQGDSAYTLGHVYKYVVASGDSLYAWRVSNPDGLGNNTIVYTKSLTPAETTLYKANGEAYDAETDDPTFEFVSYDSATNKITVEILDVNSQETWEKTAGRISVDDRIPTSGWVDVTAYITAGQKDGTALGTKATAEGEDTESSGAYAHAEGLRSEAKGNHSHAEGFETTALGESAHTEGSMTYAEGDFSHAEGAQSEALGKAAHAENWSYVTGDYSHGEGSSIVYGKYAHGEGTNTLASGDASHAGGIGTKAQRRSQMTMGEYNVADTGGASELVRGKYVVIIGNGTGDNARSNALTLDWDGNLEVSGDVEDGNGEKLSDKADKVTNATSGHFAGLDANGNLTDSGHSDVNYVHKTGNEDIAGNKHFTGDVIVDGNIIGKKGTIYGFHIDNTEDDPDEKITYMYDAVGMKPAKMNFVTGKFDYGSWENAFFMPRPCMLKFDGTVDYYLDPNDYSKKEDGTASDVADLTCDANAMMEWGRDGKKIWVKIEPTSSDKKSANILIADYQVDPNYKAWSFINNQGDLVDHFYTAIYKGSLDSNNRMRSISGQDYTNYVNDKTRAEEIALAEANNPSTDKLWYTEVRADNQLINFLTILMFKSTDIQAKLGEGRTGFSWTQSNVATTGIMDDKGLFYGESSSTGLGCKLFGREQPYGDIWMAEAGFLNVNGTLKTKLTYGTQDGSTAVGYNFDGTGYTAIDVTLPSASANYIGEMIYDSSYGMIPVATGGNEHIDYCDALWTNDSQTNYALRGGDLAYGRRCGAFCLNLRNVAGTRTGFIGAALSCKPLA